jgi:hypothetical protein
MGHFNLLTETWLLAQYTNIELGYLSLYSFLQIDWYGVTHFLCYLQLWW